MLAMYVDRFTVAFANIYVKVAGSASPGTLGAWKWSQLWQSEPPHRISYYNAPVGLFVPCNLSTGAKLSAKPSRCLMSILQYFVQPKMPRGYARKNKK